MWLNIEESLLHDVVAGLRAASREDLAGELEARYGHFHLSLGDHATIRLARDMYATDEIEVDESAVVSRGDEGAFVMAWVWVENEGDYE